MSSQGVVLGSDVLHVPLAEVVKGSLYGGAVWNYVLIFSF